jgi:hypothetical protein
MFAVQRSEEKALYVHYILLFNGKNFPFEVTFKGVYLKKVKDKKKE